MAAGTAPKKVAKKTAPKAADAKPETFTVTLDMARETKNTLRFEAQDEESPIDTQYVKKAAFAGTPKAIEITVTAIY